MGECDRVMRLRGHGYLIESCREYEEDGAGSYSTLSYIQQHIQQTGVLVSGLDKGKNILCTSLSADLREGEVIFRAVNWVKGVAIHTSKQLTVHISPPRKDISSEQQHDNNAPASIGVCNRGMRIRGNGCFWNHCRGWEHIHG